MADSYSQKQAGNDMPPFPDILKQISFSDPQEVSKKETGLKIAERIYREQSGQKDSLNFFTGRATRWNKNLKWAIGTQDMTEFLPYFNVAEGNKSYLALDMTPIMIGPQFVGTLVESMSKNEEYPCVSAVDDGSMEEKEKRKIDALYRMHEVGTIDDLQEQSGVNLEPPNAFVPDNELAAEVYFQLEDRLPKEIRFEKKLQDILMRSQYDRVLKRKLIFDNVVHNIEVSKIEKSNYGVCVKRCVPTNVFYSFFMNDSGQFELAYIGDAYKLKIKDIRGKYGMSPTNTKGLTEKEIYDIAKTGNQINPGLFTNMPWREEYSVYSYNRPWDDYGVLIYEFEICITLNEYSVGKVDKMGKENIAPKNGIPQPKNDTAKIYSKEKKRWYKCVYAPYAGKILYWGLPELVILPYNETECALSSYTINIPNNTGEYVPSLFERSMEPLREYCLAKLKIKQLISKLRPSGIRVDVESARNIDLGGGNTIPWEQVVRIFDQTGVELWSSKGLDPNQREAPAITPGAVLDDVQKIAQLTSRTQELMSEIRNLLGVPTYRDGGDVGDRTAAKLAEIQSTNSFNVTDFIANSHNQLMEETLYKCCLIEWQTVVKEEPESREDLINAKFDVEVKMKQTAYEKQLLEQDIQIWSKVVDPQTGKPSLSPKDVYKLRNIKNHKLAELFLASIFEENAKAAQQRSMQLQQQNAQVQAQAAQQKSEADAQMLQSQLTMQERLRNIEGQQKNESQLISGLFELYKAAMAPQKSGGENGASTPPPKMPPEMQQIAGTVLQNVVVPMVQENQTRQEQDMAQQQAEQQQQLMQQQQQQQQPPPM